MLYLLIALCVTVIAGIHFSKNYDKISQKFKNSLKKSPPTSTNDKQNVTGKRPDSKNSTVTELVDTAFDSLEKDSKERKNFQKIKDLNPLFSLTEFFESSFNLFEHIFTNLGNKEIINDAANISTPLRKKLLSNIEDFTAQASPVILSKTEHILESVACKSNKYLVKIKFFYTYFIPAENSHSILKSSNTLNIAISCEKGSTTCTLHDIE